MPKNVALCCDGTGNEFGDRNTNVVNLFRGLLKGKDSSVVVRAKEDPP